MKKGKEREELSKDANLCKGCPITAIVICNVCGGNNRELINQIIRSLTEDGDIQLYITM